MPAAAMRNTARRLKPLSRTAGLRCIRLEVIYHSRKPGRTCSLRSGHCYLTAARVRGTFHILRVVNVTARSFDETCRYAAHCSSGAVGICQICGAAAQRGALAFPEPVQRLARLAELRPEKFRS